MRLCAAYNGLALKTAGRIDAARIEWQSALKLVERGLADQPSDVDLLQWKARLLAYLGDYADADKALHQAEELSGRHLDRLELDLKIAEGQLDVVMDVLDSRQYVSTADCALIRFMTH